jgi:hypothetical protein
MLTIKGGSHCQMAEKSLPCSLAEFICGPDAEISRLEQHSIIVRYLIPWLNFYLKGDSSSSAKFDSVASSDTSIVREGIPGLIF